MKATRLFQVRETGDGYQYQLWVDDVLVKKSEHLGIEESLPPDEADSLLEEMVRHGSQRTTATAFLWQFVEERKKRQEKGGALFVWGQKIECDG